MKKTKSHFKILIIVVLICISCMPLFSQTRTNSSEPGNSSMNSIVIEQNRFKAHKIHFVKFLSCLDSLCQPNFQQLTVTREFDTNGRLIIETCYDCQTDSELDTLRIDYTYNKNNLLETITRYQFPDYPDKHLFEYNATGKLIDENYASGESRKYRFFYTQNGLVSKKIGQSYSLDSTGIFSWSDCETIEYTYNNQNLLTIRKQMYEYGWGMPRQELLFYNKKNQLIKIERFRIGESEMDWIFECTNQFFYNEFGFIEKEVVINSENEKSWFEYKYIRY